MIEWYEVGEGAKLTTQTIRAALDHHGIGYWLENAPIRKEGELRGGAYIFTRFFGIEVQINGEAIYALDDERPPGMEDRPFDETFVKVYRERRTA